jgi:AcrR family transcriptional regulator
MSPKFVNKELKIREIARAAIALFSKKGFAATSVEEIAEAAGIGKGTIYEYFKTKEGVFVAAIEEWIGEAETQILEILHGIDDPVERLQAFVNRNMDLFDSYGSKETDSGRLYIEILQQTFMDGGAFYKHHHLLKSLGDRIRSIVVDIILDGVSKGVFSPRIARDSEKIAINLIAFLEGLNLYSMVAKKTSNHKMQVDFYMQNLIQSVLTQP